MKYFVNEYRDRSVFFMTTDVSANWSMISTVDILRKLNRPMQNRYLIINAYHDASVFLSPKWNLCCRWKCL